MRPVCLPGSTAGALSCLGEDVAQSHHGSNTGLPLRVAVVIDVEAEDLPHMEDRVRAAVRFVQDQWHLRGRKRLHPAEVRS